MSAWVFQRATVLVLALLSGVAALGIALVLHHDLNSDAASVFRAFLKSHHAIPQMAGPQLSAIEIITPFNLS